MIFDIPDAWIARAAFNLEHQHILSKDSNKRSMDGMFQVLILRLLFIY